jgi:hypothetical protein
MRILLVGLWGLSGVLGVAGAGCGGGMGPGMTGDDDDPPPDPVTLAFASPTPGAVLVRDRLEPTDGWRAATLAVDVDHTGPGVASIDLSAGGLALGALDADGRATFTLLERGPVALTATARDASGAPLATATLDVVVGDPEVTTCRGWLDLYGIPYTVGPPSVGVPDPVTIDLPVNGMPFRYAANTTQRTRFFMDCSLARSLVEAAPFWRSRGVVEVADIGVYNYRCIGGGTPPDCPNGISQHAYAKAIDLAAFELVDGTTFTVETDWVIDPTAERTCEAATSSDKDAWLHALICALKGDDVWNIVLTPNYNAAHRDHFHVDLTAGSDFIRKAPPRPIDDGPDDW